MRRYAAKVDANQAELVQLLSDPRCLGASVQQLHAVGGGFPDLLLGTRHLNFLLEVKVPGGVFTEDQRTWHETWQGQARVATSASEAVTALELYARELQYHLLDVLHDCERARRFLEAYDAE